MLYVQDSPCKEVYILEIRLMKKNKTIDTIKKILPYTLPVMAGYLVLGAAFGILLSSRGYSFWWAIGTSIFIYAGSMQFVAVSLLALGFHPAYTAIMTLTVNARHLFYGISMLEKYRGMGRRKPYLILGLTDETFSIVCTTEPPEEIEKSDFYFWITLLNQIYWVTGSAIGGILGSMVKFETAGMDFVLTALFVVIFINQWRETTNHIPVIIGVFSAVLCRIIFGAGNFIIPSMGLILILVTICRKTMEERKGL